MGKTALNSDRLAAQSVLAPDGRDVLDSPGHGLASETAVVLKISIVWVVSAQLKESAANFRGRPVYTPHLSLSLEPGNKERVNAYPM